MKKIYLEPEMEVITIQTIQLMLTSPDNTKQMDVDDEELDDFRQLI